MRYFLYLLFLLTACSTSGQKKKEEQKQSLTDDQIIKRYLENGAWRVRYFSPEYQLFIDSAIACNPKMAYLYQQKSMPYFKLGKYELGLKSLDKAVELDPAAHIDYRAFIKCIFAKTYQEAINDFQTAKKMKGEHGVVMDHSYDFYLGLCHLQLGEFAHALDDLEKSIAYTQTIHGENWIHYLELFYAGIALQELNRHTEAIRYFERAIEAYSSFADAKYYLALSLFRMGEMDRAEQMLTACEQDFKKGYTINEDNAVYEKYPYQIKQFYIDLLRMTKR